jgi:hypothetical protein
MMPNDQKLTAYEKRFVMNVKFAADVEQDELKDEGRVLTEIEREGKYHLIIWLVRSSCPSPRARVSSR